MPDRQSRGASDRLREQCQRQLVLGGAAVFIAVLGAIAALTMTDSIGTLVGRARSLLRRFIAKALPGQSYPVAMLTFLQGRLPQPRSPSTVLDIISRTLLLGATPLQRRTTDKVAAATWVGERIGASWLPTRLAVVDSFEDLDFASFPPRFVLKASHGSGMIVLVRPASDRTPIRDDRAIEIDAPIRPADAVLLERLCETWLATDYSLKSREPQYHGIPRRLIVEEDLCAQGAPLVEVSIYCIKGVVMCARIRTAARTEHMVDSQCRSLNVQPYGHRASPDPAPLDESAFAKMVEAATTLAQPFDFVRVDLCEVGGRLLFSELTHTPQAGKLWFRPRSFSRVFGDFWRGTTVIPARYYR